MGMVYTYTGKLYNHKKGWNSNTCCAMDEPWKHFAKLNKLGTKGYF